MACFVAKCFNMCSILNNHSLILCDNQILICISVLLLTTDIMPFIVSVSFSNTLVYTPNCLPQNHDKTFRKTLWNLYFCKKNFFEYLFEINWQN